MAKLPQERRKKTRVPIAMPVVLQTPSRELQVESRDISPGGAFIRSATAIAVGSKVKISFTVPEQDAFPPGSLFRCEATIVRLERLADGEFGLALVCDAH